MLVGHALSLNSLKMERNNNLYVYVCMHGGCSKNLAILRVHWLTPLAAILCVCGAGGGGGGRGNVGVGFNCYNEIRGL